MKLAKIFVPIAMVGLISVLVVLWVLFVQGAFVTEPPEDADSAAGLAAGIAAVFGALFFIVMNVVVTILFLGFSLGLFICWICIFKGRNKLGALTGALVLLCLILPTVLIASILTLVTCMMNVPLSLLGVIVTLLIFLTAFIGVCVAYNKEKKLHRREGAQATEA